METKGKEQFKTIWTNICRMVLAVTFVFSGFVKAVDPLGSMYKIQDYVEAFGMGGVLPSYVPLMLAVGLSTLEFVIGVYLLFGIRKNTATILALLLMLFMTPLTLYLAIKNPVADCGCFGDAVTLTNWETFWKNILLLIAALSVFIWKKKILRMITEKLQWLVALYSLVFIVGVSVYCLYYLPIFDFRPYKKGVNIPQAMSVPEGAKKSVYESVFILEKNGERKEFTLENYPDSTWAFIDAKSILKEKGYEPSIHDFSIARIEDGEDITEQVINDKGYTFLLVAHRIEKADDSTIDLINEIYDYSREYGYAFYCLTSSPEGEIERWKDRTGAEYPFCLTDEVTLRTMIRSNPGLILLKDGVVLNKWSRNNLPDEYILNGELTQIPLGQLKTERSSHTVTGVVLCFVIPLVFFLAVDLMFVRRRDQRKREAATKKVPSQEKQIE